MLQNDSVEHSSWLAAGLSHAEATGWWYKQHVWSAQQPWVRWTRIVHGTWEVGAARRVAHLQWRVDGGGAHVPLVGFRKGKLAGNWRTSHGVSTVVGRMSHS